MEAAASSIMHTAWHVTEWKSFADFTKDKHQQQSLVGFSSSLCYHGNKKIHQEI